MNSCIVLIIGLFLIESTLSLSGPKKTSDVVLVKSTLKQRKIRDGDYVDKFCRTTNTLFESLTIEPVRNFLNIRRWDGTSNPATPVRDSPIPEISKLIMPPEVPGISRPVSLVILGSVPTALMWYGFYKFSVEEELFYDQLEREGRVTGCGGFGTLLPFVFLLLTGALTSIIPGISNTDAPKIFIEAGSLWILLGQVNLYRRVNELYSSRYGGEGPLYAWWALLPPPLDVVVGLRQVHFLAKYWADVRDEPWQEDVVAEKFFPFIASQKFTLLEFARQPSRWFWFTTDAKDFF